MTWQRIAENTYLDDSLVTCAEYQLFIDEMREQGKYHQPDHWSSYQFPEGAAREPILGVRYSDAIAFCEWLTNIKNSVWEFHLPMRKTASDNPVKFVSQAQPLGNWLMGSNNQPDFAWIGQKPVDARQISLTQIAGRARGDGFHIYALLRALERETDRSLARDRALDISYAIERSYDLDHYLDHYRTHDFRINSDRKLILDRDLSDNERIDALARYLDRALISVRDYNRPLFRANGRVVFNLRAIFSNLNTERSLYPILDFYVDAFTLRERMSGRSPAFEGIRLVKERVR